MQKICILMGKFKIRTKMIALLLLTVAYAIVVTLVARNGFQEMAKCSTQDAAQEVSSQQIGMLITISAIFLVIFIVIGAMVTYDLVYSLGRAAAYGKRVADGDLTAKVAESFVTRKDSVGDLAKSFEDIHTNLQGLIGTIGTQAGELEQIVAQTNENANVIAEEVMNVSATT